MVYVAKPPKEGEAKYGIKPYKLEAKHEKAVELLAAGLSSSSVAECVGVTQPTIINWKRNPHFRKALADTIGIDAELHKVELIRLYGKAMDRVDALLDSKNEHIRLQAGRLVFEAHQATIRMAEELEMVRALEERMDELQAAAANGQTVLLDASEDAEFVELDDAENGPA